MLTEKQKEIVEKVVIRCEGSQEECIYAAVEAVLATQPTAQPCDLCKRTDAALKAK